MKTLTWNKIAVCLGNGQSRQGLDLEKMKKYATVIGCNAIYRDFTPDILVAVDSRISHEIYRKANLNNMKAYLGYWTPIPNMVAMEMLRSCKTKIDSDATEGGNECVYHGADGVFTAVKGKNLGIAYVTEVKEKQGPVKSIEPDVDGFAYATGSRSVHLACDLGAETVFIVGHDLYSDNDKINNLYAGTKGYSKKDALAMNPNNPDETYNWILQHKNTFDKFSKVQFYKVNSNTPGDFTASEIPEWSSCANLKYITQEKMAQMLYN
tara:strand:- start:315 stop:1112 length:798 start_codon:yes stop_codon:yes gene_type:complete